MSNIFNF